MMSPNQIRAKYVMSGIKQRAHAKKIGVSPQVLCEVIKGRTTSRRIMEAVAADLFKLPPEKVWGKRYPSARLGDHSSTKIGDSPADTPEMQAA
jgi:lambda repressor-like predicted transcriptional regulator